MKKYISPWYVYVFLLLVFVFNYLALPQFRWGYAILILASLIMTMISVVNKKK